MDIKKRLERIVHIFFILQSRSFITNQDLQDRFKIGRRTVYRDLKVLEEAGVPVVNENGQGFSIMEGYRMMPSRFTQEEVLSLMIAEKLMQKHDTQFVKKSFESALVKIKSSFRLQQKDDLVLLDDKFRPADTKAGFELIPDLIETLLSSVLNKKIVVIGYQKTNETVIESRRVEPIGVFHELNSWYVLTWCQKAGDYRKFRLDRIKKIVITTDEFSRVHPPIDELRNSIDKDRITRIVISVDSDFAHFLLWERNNYGYISEEIIGQQHIMTFGTKQMPETFVRWFMRFADVAKIIEPESVRDLGNKIIRSALKKNIS